MCDDRRWLRTGLTGLYGFIGVVHLTATERFLPIMPGWVPQPRLVVIGTGLCEIAGALALFVPRLRRLAGIMLALYAVCVFPANIKQAVEGIAVPPIPDTWWYHGPRLALQPVMVWWALYAVHVIDWPFTTRKTGDPRVSR
ncbi:MULTISPECIES: DoxX family protein [Methylorubrum]|uniref:DoxX family protein n=1 Tax=Methylorubrum TaxID=2282523 RepID=UPI00209CF237|nr:MULTISPECIES: DoxX family protein [Methylorubrum]MCP1549749.1 putative membrane protein [Methylorubrum zatmanii]MCP1553637.1 putative membrane protein [Methylorubrum extorquens]MCP1580051.1 putative membrane protein [Methylorubrum extorquens]